MESPKETEAGTLSRYFTDKLQETMKKGVNEDEIRIETIDTGRKNKVKLKVADVAVPGAAEGVEDYPTNESKKMGAGNRRNFTPKNRTRLGRARGAFPGQSNPLGALSI
jgi:hypothetical protein